MAKIKNYRQFGTNPKPSSLEYGLIAITKTGDMYIGNESNAPNLVYAGDRAISSATRTNYGLPSTAVLDDVLKAVLQIAPWNKIASYTTAGSFTWNAPNYFGGKPYNIGVCLIGGGGSGQAYYYRGSNAGASGGSSGRSTHFIMSVNPGSSYNGVVGSGGFSVTSSDGALSPNNGNSGGTTSFYNRNALGGSGGGIYPPEGAINPNRLSRYGGSMNAMITSNQDNYLGYPLECFNWFEMKSMLAAGGSVFSNIGQMAGKNSVTGFGGGNGSTTPPGGKAQDATESGCGGGGSVPDENNIASPYSTTSGKGADGAVFLYLRGLA